MRKRRLSFYCAILFLVFLFGCTTFPYTTPKATNVRDPLAGAVFIDIASYTTSIIPGTGKQHSQIVIYLTDIYGQQTILVDDYDRGGALVVPWGCTAVWPPVVDRIVFGEDRFYHAKLQRVDAKFCLSSEL